MLVQEKNAPEKARTRADRPGVRSDSPSTMFDKVLRAFSIGDLSFSDLQSSLTRLLKDGAPPDELLTVLRGRESIEPLPAEARENIVALLQEAQPPVAAVATEAAERLVATAESTEAVRSTATDEESESAAMTRLIQEAAAAWDVEPKARPAAVAAPTPVNTGQNVDYKTMRLALGQREDDFAALQAEHSRVLGLLEARARSAAKLQDDVKELAAHLEQSRGALLAQQAKTREMEEVLAERIALEEALRKRGDQARLDEAARLSEVHRRELEVQQKELEARQKQLEARQKQLEAHQKELSALRETLEARDAQLASLQGEHARMVPQLESGAQRAAKLQAELAAAQARISALEADAATFRARAIPAAPPADSDAWADKILAMQRSLEERNATIEAQKQQHSKVVASLMARGKASENELQAARVRIDALASELQSAARASASVREREREALQLPDLEHTMPLPPVDESPLGVDAAAHPVDDASPPVDDVPPGLRLRRGLEIGDFSAPPLAPLPARPGRWYAGAIARTGGICALIALLAIVAWAAARHASPAAKAPEAAAPRALTAGAVIRDCAACPPLTVLPAGRFKQGSADHYASPSVKPLHWVAIGHPIAMSTNAVTVDQFRTFATATGRDLQGCDIYDGHWKHQPKNSWQNPGFEQGGTHPVTCASWSDAVAYAQWLSAQTGHHYRLPSASEWEYAARAGSEAVQPWSANGSDACTHANVADLSAVRRYPGWVAFACNDGYVFTAPVGSFKANAFGLNDMLGNVFQWTEDCWNPSYSGAPLDGSARADGSCSEHELRGGSWFSSPGYVRADYRNHFAENYRASSTGIRLVRDITP